MMAAVPMYRPQQPVPELLGLTEGAARAMAALLGLTVRVLHPGRQAMTLELCLTRVNLVVAGGQVTSALIF